MSKVIIKNDSSEELQDSTVRENMNIVIAFVESSHENNPDMLYRMAVACITGLSWHEETEALGQIMEHAARRLETAASSSEAAHRAGVKAILDLAAAGDTEAIARLKFLAEKYAP